MNSNIRIVSIEFLHLDSTCKVEKEVKLLKLASDSSRGKVSQKACAVDVMLVCLYLYDFFTTEYVFVTPSCLIMILFRTSC